MTKSGAISLFLFFLKVSVLAQDATFSPGWYIVEQGATYSDYDPLSLVADKEETVEVEVAGFSLKAGESIFATEISSDVYYCFDPSGTPLLIKGRNSLSKAPKGFGIGIILTEIQLLSGESLSPGMYVWIIGQDIAKQTIKVQLNNSLILEIPESKISLLTALVKKNAKATWFKEVE